MTGIFLIVVCLVWLALVLKLAIAIAGHFKRSVAKLCVGVLVFVGLLPLPLVDEIVGQGQFDSLCRTGAALSLDEQRIKGRKIKLAFEPANAPVPNIAVSATYTRVIFRDAASGEELGSYSEYVAKGGWLIRALGISESNSPLWISPSYCSPDIGPERMAAKYEFEIVR